jgi:hypothetical protein
MRTAGSRFVTPFTNVTKVEFGRRRKSRRATGRADAASGGA